MITLFRPIQKNSKISWRNFNNAFNETINKAPGSKRHFSSRSYMRSLGQECIKTSTMTSPMAIGWQALRLTAKVIDLTQASTTFLRLPGFRAVQPGLRFSFQIPGQHLHRVHHCSGNQYQQYHNHHCHDHLITSRRSNHGVQHGRTAVTNICLATGAFVLHWNRHEYE